jgi:hypothetical protein
MEGVVYPDFDQCRVICTHIPYGSDKKVGGIDFGFRNPFAAIWGVLTHDDILWINQERYLRETPLHEHAAALPRGYFWVADPAGRTEIEELRAADHKVIRGNNDIRVGIAAVTARIRTGRLMVCETGCRNLLAEAKLYRYPTEQERALVGENPIDEHNHALGALRYLITRIDHKFVAKLRKKKDVEGGIPEQSGEDARDSARSLHGVKFRSLMDNPEVWTRCEPS